MLRKLYSLVSGATIADNPDSAQHHEVLLPGFLYGMIIKERFEECLVAVRAQVMKDIREKNAKDFRSRQSLPARICAMCSSALDSAVLPISAVQNKLGRRL